MHPKKRLALKIFFSAGISGLAISCAPQDMSNNYRICDDSINKDCGQDTNVIVDRSK